MKPKVLILRTAGTNCDNETAFAYESAGAKVSILHLNYVKEKQGLKNYQIICLPGGFSYGDDLGAGKIFSMELILWFKDALKEFTAKGGLILGICNGFQVLAKTGILPDLDFKQKVTLTFNDSGKFEDRWTYLKIENRKSKIENRKTKKEPENIWLKDLQEIISLPVAHGEGKFYAEDAVLNKIEKRGQVVLRYADKEGNLADYPYNPNGSMNNIAGIVDATGKILGIMPHPERNIFKHQNPLWKKEEEKNLVFGLKIFENGVKYFKS